jgi:hypothetical protein
MPDYLFLMHGDAPPEAAADGGQAWAAYLGGLREAGCLQGGSAIGGGLCARKAGPVPATTAHLTGFIRVSAASLDQALARLAGNPVYEAGGTVEIRELPRTD